MILTFKFHLNSVKVTKYLCQRSFRLKVIETEIPTHIPYLLLYRDH